MAHSHERISIIKSVFKSYPKRCERSYRVIKLTFRIYQKALITHQTFPYTSVYASNHAVV